LGVRIDRIHQLPNHWIPDSTATDPKGAVSGSYRVGRGGSWGGYAVGCRAAIRYDNYPTYSNSNIGFRVAPSSAPMASPKVK
jgi:formylglycine-generating enzyme required for sulfatase activity